MRRTAPHQLVPSLRYMRPLVWQVTTSTLDDLLAAQQPRSVDMVKLDAEGHEVRAGGRLRTTCLVSISKNLLAARSPNERQTAGKRWEARADLQV